MIATAGGPVARLSGSPLVDLPRRTLNEALAWAATSGTGVGFLDVEGRERRLPYYEVYERARRTSGALRSLGVGRGDRVALILPTAVSFLDAFFGALLAGAVPVPLYPPIRLGRLGEYHERTAAMLQAVGAAVLVTDGRIRRLLGRTTELARPPLGCRAIESLEGARPREVSVSPADLALIQFSSGTTREPKPVALTHGNILANLSAIDAELPGGRNSAVSWLPLYHDMGLIGCLLAAVTHPGPLTLIPPEVFLARPSLWLRAISEKRATISAAPNFAYGLCLKRVRDEDMEGVDLSSWTMALNGAETISPDVARRFGERFSRWKFDPRSMTPVYGLSEAALAVTFTPRDRGVCTALHDGRDVVSVGRPVAGVEVEVRPEEGVSGAGRIFTRGPSVMSGYFRQTESPLVDGWLDTGDLGFVSGGELYISGRKKDVIVLRGQNHAPQIFEETLEGVRGVRTGCVAAVGFHPEGADGEELALLVETNAEADETLEERIVSAVLTETGVRPHTVKLLAPGTLPRTSSGKMRRGEARRLFLSDQLSPPATVGWASLVSAFLESQWAFVRSRRRLEPR